MGRDAIEIAVDEFLSFRSTNTNRLYRRAFALWRVFLSGLPYEVDPRQIARWAQSLAQRRGIKGGTLSDNTIQKYFAALSSIYSYLYDFGYLDSNPFTKARRLVMWRQPKQVRPTALIPDREVRRILRLPDISTKEGVRDKAILALFFGGALRRSEILGLNIPDLEWDDEGFVYVRLWNTKARKVQDQALPKWASKAVKALVRQRKKEEHVEGALILNYRGYGKKLRRMSESTLYRLFRGYARRIGIEAAPHAARATALTRLRRLGVSDDDAAHYLRHSSTAQVRIYDKRDRERKESPGRRLHWNGKRKKISSK